MLSKIFFFNDTATTEIYTLSLHDALPIPADHECCPDAPRQEPCRPAAADGRRVPELPQRRASGVRRRRRSEEHTSELQSQSNLVCRLLLEKKNIIKMELAAPSRRLTIRNA